MSAKLLPAVELTPATAKSVGVIFLSYPSYSVGDPYDRLDYLCSAKHLSFILCNVLVNTNTDKYSTQK